jgi:transposase
MKAYSHDIRQRIINTYQNGEGSQRQIAARFHVSLSFVRGLLRRFRQTGSIEPKPHGGGPAPRIGERDLEFVRELLREDPGATLGELCERVASRGGVRPSRATMSRAVRKLRGARRSQAARVRAAASGTRV